MQKLTGNREDIHPDEIAIIEEIESLVNFTLELFDHIVPRFSLNKNNRITGINFGSLYVTELDQLALILKKLPHLDTLNFRYTYITNLAPIAVLKGLQKLIISDIDISDLSPVSFLTGLKELDISNTKIDDLTPISTLTGLTELHINSTAITDLTPLLTLTALRELGFYYSRITDITPLASCTALQTLGFSYTRINNISPLSGLTRLQELHISHNKFTDITPLAALTGLQKLDVARNSITDLTPLTLCTALQNLNISSTGITDIAPLANLNKLKTLNCYSTCLTDITPIFNLSRLQQLDLSYTNITYFDEQLLQSLPNLEQLNLRGNPINNIPHVITELVDCLVDLKNYFKDYTQGKTPAFEAKIILTGNGRVGKTCLVKRWLDNTFDAAEPSTHAIQLRPWQLNELAKQEHLEHIRLNIWDFGGQDIYHATHRTFMRTEAVFLLVWDMQTENIPEQQEILQEGKTIRYKNYPIEYWLSYIKTLSYDSPVILVQTHRGRDEQLPNVLTDVQQNEYNVKAILAVESSAVTANGFETLKERIQEIVVEQIKESCTAMPASWYNIRMRIAQLQEERQIKQLALSEFNAMCSHERLDNSSMQTLLKYFHHTGVFFYKDGLFNNQIVIDQKWAIDAVYILLDRKGHFARIHNNGHFTGGDLQEYWQHYSLAEQKLFVSFMKQCEICYEMSEDNFIEDNFIEDDFWGDGILGDDILEIDSGRKSFAEKKFIAPQLLPENPPLSVSALRRHGDGVYYKYRHKFLHVAIIQRFIVRTVFMAKENDMWQSGIVLNTPEGMALIEAYPAKNEIIIRLDDVSQNPLLKKIRNEMAEINADETGIKELVSLDGVNFINLESLKNNPSGNEQIQAENGNWIVADKLRMFLELPKEEVFEKTDEIKKTGKKASPSTKKVRKSIPQQTKVRAELQKEIDNICPFCSNEDVGHFEIHHIDEDPGNNDFSNLLLVCPTCHSKIDKRDIRMEAVVKKKEELKVN
jgi:Leucine-rich repeat (LRR) protein/GTPase SAR1 family protein